jgi:hypothetical protein
MADGVVYAIDTSSLVAVRERFPDEREIYSVWMGVFRLIDSGRLKTVRLVFDEELPRHDNLAYETLKPHRGKMVVPDGDIAAFVGGIQVQFPSMAKPFSLPEKADPWVLALALSEGYTVVTDETLLRRPRSKIPYACNQLAIPWTNLEGMLKAEGII